MVQIEELNSDDNLGEASTSRRENSEPDLNSIPLRSSSRIRYPVRRFMHESYFTTHHSFMSKVMETEPETLDEAMANPSWVQAMLDEYAALQIPTHLGSSAFAN